MQNYPCDKAKMQNISRNNSKFKLENWRVLIKRKLVEFFNGLKDVSGDCGRNKQEVKVIFATKYLEVQKLVVFIDICKEIDILPIVIGENRVQDWQRKYNYICQRHKAMTKLFKSVMIGNLQKNKINRAIEIFEEIHSIDSLKLAKALDERLGRKNKSIPIFLEVNISGEVTKHGFSLEEIDEAILAMKQFNNVTMKGLMTMAPLVSNAEEVRSIFRKLKQLADRYGLLTSMGMSNDWEVAVEEGADLIRIGARIFQI